MVRLLLSIFLVGCATTEPLTEMEQLYAEEKEQERKEMYLFWKEWCARNGVMVVRRSMSCSVGPSQRNCIPHKSEWNYKIRIDKNGIEHLKVISGTYSCVENVNDIEWWG